MNLSLINDLVSPWFVQPQPETHLMEASQAFDFC